MNSNFMLNVYNTPQYHPFEFLKDYEQLCQKFKNTPVICNGYAIVVNQNQTNYRDILLAKYESPLLTKHRLCVLKWPDKKVHSIDIIDDFRTELLKVMLAWEERYIAMLVAFFKERVSENRTLINHNSIKIQVGIIVAEIAYATEILKNKNLHAKTAHRIKEIAIHLHKLAGGRGFLDSNIVEMLCLFDVFKKVYFI